MQRRHRAVALGDGVEFEQRSGLGPQDFGGAFDEAFAAHQRHGGDELAGVLVLRVLDDLADRTELDELAQFHHREVVHRLGHQPHVVADEDEARADLALNLAQGLHDLALGDDIERGGRLVGDDEVGFQADADGDADPLLHAARQLVRIELPGRGGQADAFEHRP